MHSLSSCCGGVAVRRLPKSAYHSVSTIAVYEASLSDVDLFIAKHVSYVVVNGESYQKLDHT